MFFKAEYLFLMKIIKISIPWFYEIKKTRRKKRCSHVHSGVSEKFLPFISIISPD